jgi:two-component system CheB/CheR fusion protein
LIALLLAGKEYRLFPNFFGLALYMMIVSFKNKLRPNYIVGIGGSAGGLIAYLNLLAALPVDTGMAFVFVAHLSPSGKSMLTQLLAKSTSMPVSQASEGMAILPNHIYVIPPNTDLYMNNFAFEIVSPRTLDNGRHRQVDQFLISLAENMGERAIGIILSGGDGDGTEGCRSIKARGGKTFAQDLSAEVDSMPLHAQASGCVDAVLSPAKIAKALQECCTRPVKDSELSMD